MCCGVAYIPFMPSALVSVYDKSGIVEFALGLHDLGWRIISSGGTAKVIAAAGIPVADVADITGIPAILGHRVVTLHPKIHGALLGDPTNPEHVADMQEYGIEPISLTVVNLYPFSSEPGIELIDIGGPAMIRASAKNHAHVAVVVDPHQYAPVLAEITSTGQVSPASRLALAREAFAHTAAYDAAIVSWFDELVAAPGVSSEPPSEPSSEPPSVLAPVIRLGLDKVQSLRYGENPHQQGARYRIHGQRSWWDEIVQHGGKELSYLNLYDSEAAWKLVNRFEGPACVIVKHANPCGVAVADDIATAYVRANACDPVSAFGGIVACNRTVTQAMAVELAKVALTEVVIAPDYDADALQTLTKRANVRVLSAPRPFGNALDIRSIDGGLLVQQVDPISLDRTDWNVVTDRQPTTAEWADLVFAWQVCAIVSSNAIVFAKDLQAFGIGAGQQNRLDSARIAAERAAGRASGGVCASDAYFPFRDGLDATAAAGIAAVIEPGGSIRDAEVIAAANEHGMTMVFTGQRHFKH